MTMELIDKNEAIKVLQDTPCGSAGIKARMVGRIEKMPTVDVLEQIRAEIEQERDKVYQNRQGCDTYYADGLDTALDIIDKYKGVKE